MGLSIFSSEAFIHLLHQYGSIALFFLLALGIFALPIPDETLLVLSGLLIAQAKLPLVPTLIAAYTGSMFGITLSYILGFFVGKKALFRFGGYIGITHEKMKKVHEWFERFGKWTLLFGYYIPGIRHLTGFASGSAYLKYWEFATFAYTGAIIWVSTFLSIGYFFYQQWQHMSFF